MRAIRLSIAALAVIVFAGNASAGLMEESAGLVEEIDQLVVSRMAKDGTPGVAIGVVSKGEVLLAKGYGLANVEHNVPVTPSTVFQSASVGKQFTATAVMLLVEDGKVRLDDSITKYFPDAPQSWGPIKVRHLLTHTSGISNFTATLDRRRDYSEDQLAQLAYRSKLEFVPGARWSYSNTGYVLLGILVHRVSGQFYGDVLKERVFAPLGMKTARVISEADIVPNRAAGYRTVDGELKNQEWVAPKLNTTADGALYLSLLDLIAWDQGLRSRAILKPATWTQIFTPVTLNSGRAYPYGFGWYLEEIAGEPVQWHGGSWQGFRAAIVRYVKRDLTIITLRNHADSSPLDEAIAAKIDPRLAVPAPTPIADLEPVVSDRVKGLLEAGQLGKLASKDFRCMPADWLPPDGYEGLLKPLGPLERVDLLQRRELGDDGVYLYDAVYATRTLRVDFALAPGDCISLFSIQPR